MIEEKDILAVGNKILHLTYVLNKFAKQFDITVIHGHDFEYRSDSNTIAYSLIVTDNANKTFNDFVHTDFPNVKADIFLWSFLHEIGHRETEDDFEDEEWEEYINCLNNWHDTDNDYYHLPIEYAATNWAYNYMMNNSKEIDKLWSEVHSIIMDIYSLTEE